MVIAEIGVFKGEFSKYIIDQLEPKELHLIDIFEGMMCSGDKDGNNIIWIDIGNEFIKLSETYSYRSNIHIHKGRSSDILSQFPDSYFDMIYIDADHSYNGTMSDLMLAKNKVKKDGIISGHDYTRVMFPGVVDAVDNFCKMYDLEINSSTLDGCPSFLMYNTDTNQHRCGV
jgi:hypothetical protein